jgi:hypothetical protein
VGHERLQQFIADGRVSPEALAILRARHEYRAGRLPHNTSDGDGAAAVAADIRMELIAAERSWRHGKQLGPREGVRARPGARGPVGKRAAPRARKERHHDDGAA